MAGNAHEVIDTLIIENVINSKPGNRNMLEELLFSPWIADMFKKPHLFNAANSLAGGHLQDVLQGWFPPEPPVLEQGARNLARDIEGQQQFLESRRFHNPYPTK